MINLLPQSTDTIPLILRNRVVASVDSIPGSDFSSFQFLPLDASKAFFDVEAIDSGIVLSGLEGIVRPFMQQFASVHFLFFTLLFLLSALILRKNGEALLGKFTYIFTFGNRSNTFYSDQITTSDLWSNTFFTLQTFGLYTILFIYLATGQSILLMNTHDYLMLFAIIFACISLFVFGKYIFYKFVWSVFSTSKVNALTNVYLGVVYLTGILSFIPIIAYAYIPEIRMYVLFLLSAIFIIGRIAVFIKSFTFFVKSHIGILYFFVYLCGVEIMPYFLLYKAIVLIN